MLVDDKVGEASSERLLEEGTVFQEIIKVRSNSKLEVITKYQ